MFFNTEKDEDQNMMTDNSSSNSKSTFYSTQSSLSNLNANVGLFDSQTIPNEAVTAAPIPSEYDQSNFNFFWLIDLYENFMYYCYFVFLLNRKFAGRVGNSQIWESQCQETKSAAASVAYEW